MVVRRAFWYWQFIAVVALPVWLIAGWSLRGAVGVSGRIELTPLVVVLLSMIGQSALALVFSLRREVRRVRAVSRPDAAVLAAFALAVVGVGFFGPATGSLAAVAVLAVVGGLWLGVVELVRETRQRIRATLGALGLGRSRSAAPPRTPIDAGEYVVVPRSTKP